MRILAVLAVVGTLTACTTATVLRPVQVVAAPEVERTDATTLVARLDRLAGEARDTADRMQGVVRTGRQQRAVMLARLRTVEDLAPPEYRQMVVEAAERHGISPRLLAAVVSVESRWDPLTMGTSGEIGLTQVMPDTAAWIARVRGLPYPDLADPLTSLDFGAWYLSVLLRETGGDEAEALARYNGGNAYRQRAPVAARGYARKVMGLYGKGERS